MSKFELVNIDAVVGEQQFYKLKIDDCCPFDEFEKDVEKVYKSEIMTLYSYMNQVAKLKSLPVQKFHFYDDGKKGYREFEFKSKHLRIYGIVIPGGKLIITGGTKANQTKDESIFRKYKKNYISYLKSNSDEKR